MSASSPATAPSTSTENPEPFRVNLNVVLTCPECKIYPPDIVERFSDGDLICGNCGLVLGDKIVDTRSEWRTFANDDQGGDDPSRVGDAANPLLNGSQLDTTISLGQPGSSLGRDLGRIQSKSVNDKKDLALVSAFTKISSMSEAYQLPKVVQDAAKEIYKIVADDRQLKGKSQESIMAAAIFLACRLSGVERTFKEIWYLTNVPKKKIYKVVHIIETILKKDGGRLASTMAGSEANRSGVVQTTNAGNLIGRYCSHLGLSSTITNAAEYIVDRVKEEGTLAGRSPISIAAAAIYMASALFGNAVSASAIADISGVSDGTIKTAYRFLAEAKDSLIDPAWKTSNKVDMDALPKA
ncbi:hypothetical protein CANCADRAFT_57929 [Tortispora caseinolytica NRRL Y-17796]|uniref:Transcription initiation factor IIB n=1 Tax=Tortispora caseinolytica NRRL Y-17796 TaxID=767744 RepID=A0A1E4TAR8_9ASCO|nr:hypothetical protein CANCADRAFT_57929 [Tortispora caseinolytica NRRL Y-17796]